MQSNLFSGIFDGGSASVISVSAFILCIVTALIIGLFLSFIYSYKSHATKSFMITLAVLPAIVCVVIMMVNGNVGAGVAVAGAFSLVRFRSVPGSAKEIGTIFLAMGAGLICGMGYLAYAVLFVVILGLIMLLLTAVGFGETKVSAKDKTLRITIPEDLNYNHVFDEVFEKYTEKNDIVSVKTSNMGSLYKLQYNITLKNVDEEKNFIDELRCRNGNLEISIVKQEVRVDEL